MTFSRPPHATKKQTQQTRNKTNQYKTCLCALSHSKYKEFLAKLEVYLVGL